MELEVNTTAHITEGNLVQVLVGIENHSNSPVRIGSMMSKLYEIHAYSEQVEMFGESMGYLAAPHHLTLPEGESVVFSRRFEVDHPAEGRVFDEDDYPFTPLRPDIENEVSVDVEVCLRDRENITETIKFVPKDLPLGRTDTVKEELIGLPETENSIQMG